MEDYLSYPFVEKAVFLNARTGRILNLSWADVYVSQEGYLFAPDKDGKTTLVQWINHKRSGGRNV
jgi:hypothetical protein